jgi:beta-lactamase class A
VSRSPVTARMRRTASLSRRVALGLVPALVLPLLVSQPALAALPDPTLPEWPSLLQTDVVRATRAFDGEAHIYVKDLVSGVRYTYNASTPTYIASGVKLAFMVGLFRLIVDGRAALDEPVRYDVDDVRDGAPVFNALKTGTTLPLRVVLDAMVHQSDNAASDLVAKRVGMDVVNRTLADEGLTGFGPITSLLDVRRLAYGQITPAVDKLSPTEIRVIGFQKTTDQKVAKLCELIGVPAGTFTSADWDLAFRQYYRAGYNSASMESVGALLERIATGKMINVDASGAMLDVMLGTQTGQNRITAKLPPETPVAHKTGTQYQRICDLGIMYVEPQRPVVLAACMKGGSRAKGEELIALVARRTYELLAPDTDAIERLFDVDTSSLTEDDKVPPPAPPPAPEKSKKKRKAPRRASVSGE